MDYMSYLIAYVLFACAAFSLAKGKNRNPVVWVAVSLVIGPFALLIVGLMKPLPGANPDYH